MQTTPIDLLPPTFLERVDVLIRQGVRQICSLPSETSLLVSYIGRLVRGLGMLRTSWDASMQHLVIIYKISKVQDQHLQVVRDFEVEKKRKKSIQEP